MPYMQHFQIKNTISAEIISEQKIYKILGLNKINDILYFKYKKSIVYA